MQESGARAGEHTTPVLVFDTQDGERLATRGGRNGELGVFVHCIPGAAVYSLPPGVDRQLVSDELNLVVRQLRMYAKHRGEFTTPILSFDGLPLELGPRVDLNMPDPMAGHRFTWGNRSCALVVTKSVDPLLAVTTGQVYTYDDEWKPPRTSWLDRIFGHSGRPGRSRRPGDGMAE